MAVGFVQILKNYNKKSRFFFLTYPKGTCDSLGTIDDGNTVLTTNGTHTTVMFECDSGYSVDSTDYQAACEADGSWNVLVPSCGKQLF